MVHGWKMGDLSLDFWTPDLKLLTIKFCCVLRKTWNNHQNSSCDFCFIWSLSCWDSSLLLRTLSYFWTSTEAFVMIYFYFFINLIGIDISPGDYVVFLNHPCTNFGQGIWWNIPGHFPEFLADLSGEVSPPASRQIISINTTFVPIQRWQNRLVSQRCWKGWPSRHSTVPGMINTQTFIFT